eukprot:3990341-Amphidinium_carterae.3
MVNDRKMEETPVAEVSTTEGHYGVEAMLDIRRGSLDTKSEVTKVYRCADGRELRVYGYKRVKALMGKTQQILQIRFTVLDVLRPIIALSRLVQGGWDLSIGGAPVEATAHTEELREGLDVAGDAERQEHAFHEGEEQEQQEAAEMKMPVAPTVEEVRYRNLTHYPYKEWCEHCVCGRGREDSTRSRPTGHDRGAVGLLVSHRRRSTSAITGSHRQRLPPYDGSVGSLERWRRVCCEEHQDIHTITGDSQ